MSPFKRLIRNGVVQSCAIALFTLYLRFVFLTSRLNIVNEHIRHDFQSSRAPAIGVFWHGRMIYMLRVLRNFPGAMLISNHRDGELIARAIKSFGFTPIRGGAGRRVSPGQKQRNKGGTLAFLEMLRWLEGGRPLAITPDGPRGPRMRVTPGVIKLAQKSGAPIIPLAWSTTRGHVFSSWDRFLLPYPFGHVICIIGTPMTVPADADESTLEGARRTLESTLNSLTQECDRRAGRAAIEPAPLHAPPILGQS